MSILEDAFVYITTFVSHKATEVLVNLEKYSCQHKSNACKNEIALIMITYTVIM